MFICIWQMADPLAGSAACSFRTSFRRHGHCEVDRVTRDGQRRPSQKEGGDQ